jgi:hypothetical protein
MRITREMLLKTARQQAEQLVYRDRQIISIYLTGSLLDEAPLLWCTTDIDLFVIHSGTPMLEREIISISGDIHLDIAHLSMNIFRHPREKRIDPWLGPFLCQSALCLHDTQHWFEFTQAGVCAQYKNPEFVLQRARPLAEAARQTWIDLNSGNFAPGSYISHYLKSLELAANSVASLSGSPLTERRFLMNFPARAQAVDRPGLAAGLVDLLMSQPISNENWNDWMENWQIAYAAVGKQPGYPARLDPCRRNYFEQAMGILRDEYPEAALWILLRTWTQAVTNLPEDHMARKSWLAALEMLDLGVDHLEERLNALDTYLDAIEETLENWAHKYGL